MATTNQVWTRGEWLNPPPYADMTDAGLVVRTGPATDFWRETHYGFIRDNGHFLAFPTDGEFTAQMRVRGRYDHLYDQAGFMLRADAEHWIKTGVEFTDGSACLSTVVTDKWSDWSTSRIDGDMSDVWLRLTLKNGAVRIQASVDAISWPLLRLAPFTPVRGLTIGPMTCTPEREHFEVMFSDLKIGPASTTSLHDLT